MKNKVTVTIYDHDYTLVATEDESYIRQVAAYLDGQLREVMASGRLSHADGAVLTAMNVSDRLFQEQHASENLRRQLKEEVDLSARLKMELSEARREIFKLENKK